MRVGDCHDGFSVLIKETTESLLPLSLFTTFHCTKIQEQAMWVHSKMAATYRKKKKIKKKKSSVGGNLPSDIPLSRAVRNLFLLHKPPNLWYFVMVSKPTHIVLNYNIYLTNHITQ